MLGFCDLTLTSQLVGHQRTGMNIRVMFPKGNMPMRKKMQNDTEVTHFLRDGSFSRAVSLQCIILKLKLAWQHGHVRKAIHDKHTGVVMSG